MVLGQAWGSDTVGGKFQAGGSKLDLAGPGGYSQTIITGVGPIILYGDGEDWRRGDSTIDDTAEQSCRSILIEMAPRLASRPDLTGEGH